ncbi:LacI family DNA-binding transcriptional regulator [uncultured Pseudokineococcus sp.]|uniref:LacI family DNA-binding transcriptional regulator n=1 Tax=uncultured Pseudokineococcus sp. TaxID=1642928 RepID=UPI002630157E|nr:LacI family DNA-binding transcriptional regulator [uncultured Pseudokineococcus sp.]
MTTDSARPTLSTVAAEVGVSVATVSKVLNGRSDVASGTRTRVEETIERLRYQRRPARPATGPQLLQLVFHEHSSWGQEILRGVEAVACQERVSVVLSQLGGVHRPPQERLDDTLALRPLGVVFVLSEVSPTQRRQLAARSIPFVVVDTAGEPPPDVPTVGSTNWSGALAATRHLLALGHRRIAVVTGPTDVLCSRARLDGCRTALAEAGVELDPSLVRYGNFHVEGGYAHGRELLSRPDRPSAVFAGSDFQALGVLRAARELGLRVPEDLSLVGYDDLPVARWIGPALTTVRQPLQEMASTATRMVLELARGASLAAPRIDLATELVVRESTAPPGGDRA